MDTRRNHLPKWGFLFFILLLLVIYSSRPVAQASIGNSAGSSTVAAQAWNPLFSGSPSSRPLSGESGSLVNSKLYLPFVMRSAVAASVYWGAMISYPSNENMQRGGVYDLFETRAKKKLSIVHWGQSWKMNKSYQSFDAAYFENVRVHGSIPLLSWASEEMDGGATQPEFTLRAIDQGLHDGYIRQWAQSAKTWGHPFFLRFDWEMNGNWQFPWSEQLNGNQPGDYVKAWRHVHDLFTQVGATNVTWVWCPNISSALTRPMASLYPGDAYVNWTCLDGYNKESTWWGFSAIFSGRGTTWYSNSYAEVLQVAPQKPVMIGETASLEAGDGGTRKAAWLTDAYGAQLPINFPRIKAIVYSNTDFGNPAYTFPIESSSASVNAFAAAIGSSYYATNSFANLNSFPIPPLP